MRKAWLYFSALAILISILGLFGRVQLVAGGRAEAWNHFGATDLHPGPTQVRTPETVPGVPGQWPEQGKHKLVDATQLKNEAKELQGMSQELTPQIDQIGNGKLPKELIENLKKIEKLAKQIRGEIS